MKRILFIVGIVLLLFVVKIYAIYYYIYSKMTYKFSGLDFTKTGNGIENLKESASVDFTIMNNTRLNATIKKLNIKVVDKFGKEVGAVKQINKLYVPKKEQAILSLHLDNVNISKVTTDFISGNIKGYQYVVSGWLGGLMPFKYKGDIF